MSPIRKLETSLTRRPVCSISMIKASSLGLFPFSAARIKAYCSLLVNHFGAVRTSGTTVISSQGLPSASLVLRPLAEGRNAGQSSVDCTWLETLILQEVAPIFPDIDWGYGLRG